jgi:hypothetical protein
MKYNVGDIVFLQQNQVYAYVVRVGTDSVGMNWYTLKYQTGQRFGGTIVDCATYNERQMLIHVEKVP